MHDAEMQRCRKLHFQGAFFITLLTPLNSSTGHHVLIGSLLSVPTTGSALSTNVTPPRGNAPPSLTCII